MFIANKLSLKSKSFFLSLFSSLQSQVHTVIARPGVFHSYCHTDNPTKGLKDVFQGHVCSSVFRQLEFLTPKLIFPGASSGIWTHWIQTAQIFKFFFCVTTGNKGDVPFLSILSSGYVPASPRDANFHPYKDIFCRADFLGVTSGMSKWQEGYGGVIELLLLAIKRQQSTAQCDCHIPNWVTSTDSYEYISFCW